MMMLVMGVLARLGLVQSGEWVSRDPRQW
jgi:hypothetical protein